MNGLMLRDFATMRTGRVAKTDLLDLMAPHIREYNPEVFAYKPPALSSVARAPINGYRFIDNHSLMQEGLPEVHQLIREIPHPYREAFRYLETEYGLIVPVGMEDLAIFMVSEYRTSPAAFGSMVVDVYAQDINVASSQLTTAWTKPTGATLRWANFVLVGGGGPGAAGAKTITSGEDAAGGGGGGGGGYIGRVVRLGSLSDGNVVVAGNKSKATGTASEANGATPSNDGDATTFAGLTAGGGVKGTGGTQAAGAQTGTAGTGGTGDVAGTNGGTGRSGATVGDTATAQTTGPAGAGGGGGGGANADASQANAGAGGKGWGAGGLHGTVLVGGAAGTTASRTGGDPRASTGEGAGGGAGSNASAVGAGSAGDGNQTGFGNGGGGGGGRARNAATTTGSSGSGGNGGVGFAMILCF